jgi:hypothetical protein
VATSDSSAFDDAAVAAIEKRFCAARRLRTTHPVAARGVAHFAPLRAWLHEKLAGLDPHVARGFVSRLRDVDLYTQALGVNWPSGGSNCT